MVILTPFVMLLLAASFSMLFYLLVSKVKRCSKKKGEINLKDLAGKVYQGSVTGLVTAFLFLTNSYLRIVLGPFVCFEDQMTGRFYVESEPLVECDTESDEYWS